MNVLVRIYMKNADKTNVNVESEEAGFKLLKKTEYDVSLRHKWLNFEDIYFNKTKDYIRVRLN
jgi:hypothetical protein